MTTDIRATIREVLEEELHELLRDVSWRMRQLYDHGQVPAEGLNLTSHMLTGYTVTSNSPSAGHIAWSDVNVVYQGTAYGPFSGDTDDKYVWFDEDHHTNKIQTSNTKPMLGPADAILFVNNDGQVVEVLKSQLVAGSLIIDGTVNSAELADAAVTGAKILNGAVGSTKIQDDAVVTSKLSDDAVSSSKLQSNSVTTTKIENSAVSSTKIQNNAVGSSKISSNAVTESKIDDNAVSGGKIQNNAVGSSKLQNSSVTNAKLANDSVDSSKIQAGAVGDSQVQAGSLNAGKLNLLQHLIF